MRFDSPIRMTRRDWLRLDLLAAATMLGFLLVFSAVAGGTWQLFGEVTPWQWPAFMVPAVAVATWSVLGTAIMALIYCQCTWFAAQERAAGRTHMAGGTTEVRRPTAAPRQQPGVETPATRTREERELAGASR